MAMLNWNDYRGAQFGASKARRGFGERWCEDEAVAKVRPYLWIQLALFPPLPAFAASMARGYGEL
jgi:uncharacterized membrane protein